MKKKGSRGQEELVELPVGISSCPEEPEKFGHWMRVQLQEEEVQDQLLWLCIIGINAACRIRENQAFSFCPYEERQLFSASEMSLGEF
ncbi:hypothetical protein Y1Q_0004863 [Alligator mississippiensis]|uniref:Uncharacterized protein n=1 Tax=Alligator mississippiensis TaxID=8496 RepID=A0A151NR29_ALLMI|nr:hypothetical protein Y1Q_0004863 [Alligator mississippiensis]